MQQALTAVLLKFTRSNINTLIKDILPDTLHLLPITLYIFNPSVFSSSPAIRLKNETLHSLTSVFFFFILSGNSLDC